MTNDKIMQSVVLYTKIVKKKFGILSCPITFVYAKSVGCIK